MTVLDKLERRIGFLAIPGLVRIIVLFNALVFGLVLLNPGFEAYLTLDPARIMAGEVWRLVTYIFVPRIAHFLWVVIALWFLWFVGDGLERAWGAFRVTLFYLVGMIGTTIAAFFFGSNFSSSILNATLFFAFARFYPDEIIYVFFVLPLKIKWLAWIGAAFLLFGFVVGTNSYRMALLAASSNFFIFFGPEIWREFRHRKDVSSRRQRFEVQSRSDAEPLHRCATCGATELSDPSLEFRVARDGEEYCMPHLPGVPAKVCPVEARAARLTPASGGRDLPAMTDESNSALIPEQGWHCLHLFYRIEFGQWQLLTTEEQLAAKTRLASLVQEVRALPDTQLLTLSVVTPKADMAFMLVTPDLHVANRIEKQLGLALGPDVLVPVYSYLSLTEESEYRTTPEDYAAILEHEQSVAHGTPEFEKAMAAFEERMKHYRHERVYPALPDWPVVSFYNMSKRRGDARNWYTLPFEDRRKLMLGHGAVGRQYAGKIKQLITGSTGLDDAEWGVTLFARDTFQVKSIVYQMRFDPVSAEYADFGEFYIALQLPLDELFRRLQL